MDSFVSHKTIDSEVGQYLNSCTTEEPMYGSSSQYETTEVSHISDNSTLYNTERMSKYVGSGISESKNTDIHDYFLNLISIASKY